MATNLSPPNTTTPSSPPSPPSTLPQRVKTHTHTHTHTHTPNVPALESIVPRVPLDGFELLAPTSADILLFSMGERRGDSVVPGICRFM